MATVEVPPGVEMHLCSAECGCTMLGGFDGDARVQKMCAYSQATLAHAVAHNHHQDRDELHLFNNDIREAGATQLAEALRTNTTLKHLSLNRNNICDAGATQLAEALHSNTTLEHLYLLDNGITEAGVTQLADALRTNRSRLQTLLLYDNNVGAAGATQLAAALRSNTTLRTLVLIGVGLGVQYPPNHAGDAGLRSMHDAISTDNCTLETLMTSSGPSWERSFKRLLAPAPRAQRRCRMAWARRRELLLCLHAAGLLLLLRATPQPQKKTVLAGRGAFGAFGTFLADVPADMWRTLFAFL